MKDYIKIEVDSDELDRKIEECKSDGLQFIKMINALIKERFGNNFNQIEILFLTLNILETFISAILCSVLHVKELGFNRLELLAQCLTNIENKYNAALDFHEKYISSKNTET